MSGGVFLSHANEDKEFVRRLARDLRRFGAAVWVDEAVMRIGDSLLEKIKGGLQNVTHLGVVLSPHSIASEWVRREVELALQPDQGPALKLLPIVIEECELPDFARERVYADFRGQADYQREMRRVADALGLEIPKEGTDPAILWSWLRMASSADKPELLRNALYGFLARPGAADPNTVADVLGGHGAWSDGLREVAAREFLAAIDYPGSQGLAAVRYLKKWGRNRRGLAAPAALEEALTSADPAQRLAAGLYFECSGDRVGVGGREAATILPDRDQPLHLRVAAAHLCAWDVINRVLQGIGEEPRELREELMEILEDAATLTAASSLALPGLEAFLAQVPDRWLRYRAAQSVLKIMPRLTGWAQDAHAQTWELSRQIASSWHAPASAEPDLE